MNNEKVWQEVLALWNVLSEKEDCKCDGLTEFKNDILKELGLPTRISGCPFCDKFKYKCELCPIGGNINRNCIDNTPYRNWSDWVLDGKHKKILAKNFYEWLKIQHEKV